MTIEEMNLKIAGGLNWVKGHGGNLIFGLVYYTEILNMRYSNYGATLCLAYV